MFSSSSKITLKLLKVLIMSTILKHFSQNVQDIGHEQVEANAISTRSINNINTSNNNNRLRYGSGETSKNLPQDQLVNLATASAFAPTPTSIIDKPTQSGSYSGAYRVNRELSEKYHEGKLLDEEDKSLLEKFYRETKERDPFLDDSLDTETLWRERELEGPDHGLLDFENDNVEEHKKILKAELEEDDKHDYDGWTIEDDESEKKFDKFTPNLGYENKKNKVPYKSMGKELHHDSLPADYSPTLKLLTSYDPVTYPENDFSRPNEEDAIVGATLFGEEKDTRPRVKSKSAQQAIKLHDELMKKPPKDGKVRVRMYYHRAIHDDEKLYGTGPWKYWGHGWGVEFGFDPKSVVKDKDFYQKGYTIERAFGRDFCKDKKNCRQPDPDFFKDKQNVGKYSRQQHYLNGLTKPRQKMMNPPPIRPKNQVTQYKLIY